MTLFALFCIKSSGTRELDEPFAPNEVEVSSQSR